MGKVFTYIIFSILMYIFPDISVNAFQLLVNVYLEVQFYPWFKFHFALFQTHYHALTYPKTKGNKL